MQAPLKMAETTSLRVGHVSVDMRSTDSKDRVSGSCDDFSARLI